MLNKKQEFQQLIDNGPSGKSVLFRPILMHFAARHHGITYGELASDHRKLVDANIRCMEDFNTEALYTASRELISREHDRRFILSGGCEITVFTPPENLRAMARAAKNATI